MILTYLKVTTLPFAALNVPEILSTLRKFRQYRKMHQTINYTKIATKIFA